MDSLVIVLWAVPPAVFAILSWRWRRIIPAWLNSRGASPWAIHLDQAVQVTAIPAAYLAQALSPAPLNAFFLGAVGLVYGIAISPAVLPGAADPPAQDGTSATKWSSQALRSVWDELEALAGLGHSPAVDERYNALIGRLEGEWDKQLQDVAAGLATQSRVWVYPPRQWSIDIAQREIELYRLAIRLWPIAPPPRPVTPLPPEELWTFFKAFQTFEATWKRRFAPADLDRRRKALSDLRDLARPDTAKLVALLEKQVQAEGGEAVMTQPEADTLGAAIQVEQDSLFPTVWAFRGAGLHPSSGLQ